MAAIVMLAVYLCAGCAIVRWQLPGKRPLVRLWLGCSAGLVLMMWLPALCALGARFTVARHYLALAVLAAAAAAAYLTRDKRPLAPWDAQDTSLLRLWLCVALPLCVLGGVLQYTHVLRPVDGALHVGQATYGDLNLHLGIATSLRNAPFPPEYSILPGAPLSYPFLADSLSTTLLLFHLPLRWAIIVPGTLMMALVFTGYLLLAHAVLGSGKAVLVTAVLLFFLNGGLGFLYPFDMAGRDGSRVAQIFTGFYSTPTNQPELNLRWSNVVADLMLPQRTLLAGWMLLLPALYLLHDALRAPGTRGFVWTALFAGAMPWVHTHSFLALGLCSAGWVLCALRQDAAQRRALLRGSALYLVLTLALALPQLVNYAISQTLAGGSLRVQFNWVNNSQNQGLIDGYLWFWVKNVGPAFLLLLCALLDADAPRRRLAAGAFSIFVVAELLLFQPNEYDNNKLFYVWYMLAALLVADYLRVLWHRLAGLRGRWVLAGALAVCSLFSGSLSIAREVKSDYRLFDADAVACAAYVEAHTAPDAMFLTGEQHVNPVAALAGRRVVCGSSLYLYFHGLNAQYQRNRADCRRFYADPANNLDVLTTYGVDYILVSDYELGDFPVVDVEALDALFPVVFAQQEYTLYRVTPESP